MSNVVVDSCNRTKYNEKKYYFSKCELYSQPLQNQGAVDSSVVTLKLRPPGHWLSCRTTVTQKHGRAAGESPSPHCSAAARYRLFLSCELDPLPSAAASPQHLLLPNSPPPPTPTPTASFAHKHSVMLLVITVGHNFRDNFKASYYLESIREEESTKRERRKKRRWRWKKRTVIKKESKNHFFFIKKK